MPGAIVTLGEILGVRVEEIDGHPQLVLDFKTETGEVISAILDRDTARDLTRAFGRHPVVEEFFRTGKGSQ